MGKNDVNTEHVSGPQPLANLLGGGGDHWEATEEGSDEVGYGHTEKEAVKDLDRKTGK